MKIGLLVWGVIMGMAALATHTPQWIAEGSGPAALGEILPEGLILFGVLAGILALGARERRSAGRVLQKFPAGISRQQLQNLAAAKGGRLTIFQTAVAFDVDEAVAEMALEQLVAEGLASRYLDEEGVLIFDFNAPEQQLPGPVTH